jgi:hypothetical protein
MDISKTILGIARQLREIDPRINYLLDVISAGTGQLEMSTWHSCETTHCRAGWSIHFAGAAGYALEKEHGSERAGAMIYRASTGRVPCFFGSNERALEDIKRCAEEAGDA